MDIVHIDKCRYGIQEQEEVPVWYTGHFEYCLFQMLKK
jgi:hypothetical protein